MPTPIPPNRLCVSLARPTVSAVLAAARAAATLADVLEVRLDALSDQAAREEASALLLREIATPLLFTNRPTWEGGQASGPENERVRPLLNALAGGCAYVDIELETDHELRDQVIAAARDHGRPGRVIVSWHDFAGTPDGATLRAVLQQQKNTSADIGKIVTMAASSHDVRRVLGLLEEAAALDFPLIAFCMGDQGKISRLATGYLGGYMTYAAESAGPATAPGQLPAARLRQLEELLQ